MKELDDPRFLASIRIHESEHSDAAPPPHILRQNHSGTIPKAAPSREMGAPRLQILADQLASIAKELRRGSSAPGRLNDAALLDFPSDPSQDAPSDGPYGFPDRETRKAAHAKAAKNLYESRRRRATLFGNAELFGEPAWDILLDLYIAHAENKSVSVSSACIGSASPPTTGLRWLGVLAENDLILREHDPEDQRRVLVRLTERGLAAMDDYFASAAHGQ